MDSAPIPVFDTAEQIENQLLAGEDSQAEFRELRQSERGVQTPNAESVAGEMVAFANADGGALFLVLRGKVHSGRRPE